MEQLIRQINACKKCEISKYITNKVIIRGNVKADYLFIGEAPGEEEDKQGVPFVGASGKLLDEWIKFLEIEDNYAIINRLKCRPEKNRNPTKEELKNCEYFLKEQGKLINPKVVICLGKYAMSYFLPELEGILKHAGKFHKKNKVYVVPHPSYFLRNGGNGWEEYLVVLKNEINKSKNKVIKKITVDTEKKFEEFYKNINKDIFSFDTETTSLNRQKLKIVGASFYDGGDYSYYLPFNHTVGTNLNFEVVKERFKNLFMNSKLLIAHNATFDMQVLIRYGIYPEEVNWFDTKVASHLIDENSSNGLKNLSTKILGYKMTKFSEVADKNIASSNIEKVSDYACDDAIQTWKLYEIFKRKLTELDLDDLFYNIEMPFLRCLVSMEQNGVLIDKEKVNKYSKEVEKCVKNYESQIYKYVPLSSTSGMKTLFGDSYYTGVDLNSPKQLGKLLYEDLKLPIKDVSRKTGEPSTGVDALKALEKEHPIIPLILKYRMYQKLHSSYMKPFPEHIQCDGRVHCNFNSTGTVTGRLCIAKGTKIKTTNGYVNIENLCNETKFMQFIDIKNKRLVIYSKEGKRLIEKSIYKGIKDTIIIDTKNKNTIEGTYDHLIFDGKEFRELSTFKIGDYLPTYNYRNIITYSKINSIKKSKNKVYDIKILTKEELENLYNSEKNMSIKKISDLWKIDTGFLYTLFNFYNIKRKPFSHTSNRKLLSEQKIGINNPMHGKTKELHHNYGKKFDGTKHSIAKRKFIKLNPVKYKSPVTGKIVDWLTYNKHKNQITHNTKEYKEKVSIRSKNWFNNPENYKSFMEIMKSIPKEVRKRVGSIGGKAFAKKFKNDLNFAKMVGNKISAANKGHTISKETREKIRKATLNQFKNGMHEKTKIKIRIKRSKQKNVSPGYLGKSIIYYSKKYNKTFKLKSSYEEFFVKICEKTDNIIELIYEPLIIEYSNNKYYTPDFLIKSKNNEKIIEIKGEYLYEKFKNKYDKIFSFMNDNYNFEVMFLKDLKNIENGEKIVIQ